MMPHLPKDNRSFHNLARELLPFMVHKPPRLIHQNRHHPKDFLRGTQKGSPVKSNKKLEKAPADSTDSTSIPDPIPDTGIKTTQHASATTVGSTMIILPPVSLALSMAEASLASATKASSESLSMTSIPSISPSTTTNASIGAASMHQEDSNQHHLSVITITLLAVGSGFALLGILIIFKICSRPTKRAHPIPSNPILQDDYPPEKYPSDESPVFGGKDRLSTTNSGHTSTLWPWTQYHSGIPKPAPAAKSGTNIGGAVGYVITDHEKGQYPSTTLTVPATNHGNMLHPVQNAVTRVASRLSTVSMSLYPNSPRDPYDVGVAIDGGSYTADGLPVLTRTQTMPRKRNSALGSASTRYSQGFAYSGVDFPSPALPPTSQSLPKIAIGQGANAGRARVKSSYYAPGAYPRVSNANPDSDILLASKNQTALANSGDKLQPVQRSESRRDRDTQALTSALGLMSPIPPSPQPTLYPDDSLSVAGDYSRGPALEKSTARSYTKPMPKPPVARHRLDLPPVDSADTLGSLMLVDFSAGLTPSRSVKEVVDEQRSYANLKRADDKPPRVPSPPPLPSLAQMGLAHANPEAYADYRSPTYSIYGLYEADRKSKATSFGY